MNFPRLGYPLVRGAGTSGNALDASLIPGENSPSLQQSAGG